MAKSSKSSNSKRQHYIPQFLLRNFSDNRQKLEVYDKRKRERRKQSIKDVAHENYLYVLRGEDGASHDFEGLTAKVDDWGSAAVRQLIATRAVSKLIPEDRHKLSYFAAAMMIRTPQTRRRLLAVNQHMISKWGPDIRHEGTDERLGDYTEQQARNSMIQMLVKETPGFASLMREKVWYLVEAPTGSNFYLSDNPVVFHNLIERPLRGNLGLTNEGIEIYLPLSPNLCFAMLCPVMAERAMLVPETGLREALRTDTPVRYGHENVTHLNSLQVINADRFLFSVGQDFSLAEEMTATHPDLVQGTGMRYFAE